MPEKGTKIFFHKKIGSVILIADADFAILATYLFSQPGSNQSTMFSRFFLRILYLVFIWMIVHCNWATIVGLRDFKGQADVAIVPGNLTAKNFITLNQTEHFRSAVAVSSFFHLL